MDRKELLIIIPAYNEEKNIPKVLDQLEKPEITSIADVLVMNDASTDMTGEIVKARHHMLMAAVCSLDINMRYAEDTGMSFRWMQTDNTMSVIFPVFIRD